MTRKKKVSTDIKARIAVTTLHSDITALQEELRLCFEKRRELGFGAHKLRSKAPTDLQRRIRDLTIGIRILKQREDSLARPTRN